MNLLLNVGLAKMVGPFTENQVAIVIMLYALFCLVVLEPVIIKFNPRIGWSFDYFIEQWKEYINQEKDYIILMIMAAPACILLVVICFIKDKHYQRCLEKSKKGEKDKDEK